MQDFYCNKRFDISFTDFHKLVKLVLPTNYSSKETRGIYKRDYMPCNIIELTNDKQEFIANIYCWLGQRGLTVLTDTQFSTSICLEVLKEVKQNPEDFKSLSFNIIDESKFIEILSKEYLIYKQTNSSNHTSKYIIKEYNGDEVQVDFFYEPDSLRVAGAATSLLTYILLSIDKLKNSSEVS